MKNHQIQLIDTTYPVKDAKEVLFSLINDKIKFLNQRIFSMEECYSSDTSHLQNRRKRLKAELMKLLEIMEHIEGNESLVEIDCRIDLKITEPELSNK